eukprot:Skav209097  [mRNA]  locus=scaffold179:37005:48462:+ [translate_table: standard]
MPRPPAARRSAADQQRHMAVLARPKLPKTDWMEEMESSEGRRNMWREELMSRAAALVPEEVQAFPGLPVSSTAPAVPVAPEKSPFLRRKGTPGNLAAAFLPYPASEISSLQSGWRADYWKEPSPMFTQGLLSQDLRYSTECSQCKCVVKEAKLPPSGHISAEELQQEHRLRWLDSLIKQEEKAS